jgi:hypothetical protein
MHSQLVSISGGRLLHPPPLDAPCRGDKVVYLRLRGVLLLKVSRSKLWTHFSFPRAFYTFASLILLDFIGVVINIKWNENYKKPKGRRHSVVGIAIDYGLDDRGDVGVRVLVGSRIFSSPRRPAALGPIQLPIQWAPGALSPGVKRPRFVQLTPHLQLVRGQVNLDLYIHPICLHSVVLN